jgi:hypothetical protein
MIGCNFGQYRTVTPWHGRAERALSKSQGTPLAAVYDSVLVKQPVGVIPSVCPWNSRGSKATENIRLYPFFPVDPDQPKHAGTKQQHGHNYLVPIQKRGILVEIKACERILA